MRFPTMLGRAARRSAPALALVLAASPLARAQQSTGPDLITGDIPEVSGGAAATVNGTVYNSWGFGSVVCNKGNQNLSWRTGGSENRHPVIAENLFRLQGGRFEQVGQGWVKHGFFSLNGSLCGSALGFGCAAPMTGSPPMNDGTQLGVGCSDTYGSALSNTTSGMGPKWQVNPSTGLFPFPAATGAPGGVRVRPADLAGADHFIAEVQYVSADDAAAGNKNNNASWREVTIAPNPQVTGAYTMAPTGAIHREQPAVYAWQAFDPAVSITTADVPGDGRFVLACRVTGPVSGVYTYEYALQNLNSHRGAGSFTVALPGPQPALTGVGFHDAESVGEPYSLASPANPASDDWAVTGGGAGATQVTWSGPAYAGTPPVYTLSATTPNLVTGVTPGTGNDSTANALRWGMLFNFRFSSTIAPAAGQVTVGLFRPGTPSTLVIGTLTPGGAPTAGGACCTGTACAASTPAACTGVFQGNGTACGPVGNPTTCCPANFNGTGGISVQDIFDFMAAYFAGC